MSLRPLLSLLACLVWLGVIAGPPLLAQEAVATVVIVIDDTQVRPGDGPRVAELIDRLERDVLDGRTAFGIVTVGPAGLNVDLTRERRRLREASEAARAGRFDFTLTPNPDLAAAALVATLEGVVGGLAKRPAPQAVVLVGRATRLAETRRLEWLTLRQDADAASIRLAWFDLGRERRQAERSVTDASVAAKDAMCATMTDTIATAKVIRALAELVRR